MENNNIKTKEALLENRIKVARRSAYDTWTERLIKEADEAIAWGYPDNESVGYSHGQFISLIRRLKDKIIELDKELKAS